MPTSTTSHPPPRPTFDQATCEIIVHYRVPSIHISPADFVNPVFLNRPGELSTTDLDGNVYTATHHIRCLLSEVSQCLAIVPMTFVRDFKVVTPGYLNPKREEEDGSETSADERVDNPPATQTKCDQQEAMNTHVDADEESQDQHREQQDCDHDKRQRPLGTLATYQLLQQRQWQEAQQPKSDDRDYDDLDDIVPDYKQDGEDVQQESVGRSNKRKVLPFGSTVMEALQAGVKRRKEA
ncbi:UTP-glucose-1-phosphate uridylyltransferase [Pseudozyma hubeiensis SY62]|uniref:UTP-glucose-1-phosphate uridylyltransferase n=1 Tax=Pseudozyma hubeiensis (strain SY62) TaxID=1305764 RepID=R9P393_PSEHS|nr:UTP-glucose-1-phosphate uridylyltransferase [Pseudozyma hubeiensis SY62]GAC95898.1 UTP-glucose-1-phosphate uridylyltransferase [Pseudozyma hubeiensis SY62]